jgi:putative Holliday junction resolvase
LAELARSEGAARIVVGLPISLDGTHGPQAVVSERFAERLRRLTEAEVVLWDERFSSKEADLQLRALGKRARKAKSERDAVAASIILQTYLDGVSGGLLAPTEHDLEPASGGRQRARAGAEGGRWTV